MFCRKLGSEEHLGSKAGVTDTVPASYFTDLEKKEHKCLKTSTVFILHFSPSLRFTLSLQSAFYTQSAFYP